MKVLLVVVTIVLSGCAPKVHPLQVPETPVVPPPVSTVVLPPEIDQALVDGVNLWKKTKKAPVLQQNGMTLYPYSDGITIRCQSMRITDIALAPGEKLYKAVVGNADEWTIAQSMSGEGDTKRTHILLSPNEPKVETDFHFYTSRRMYTLKAIEGGKAETQIGFWFPGEVEKHIAEREAAIAKANVSQQRTRNERYSWSGDAPFSPVVVFDDDTRVYILMGDIVGKQKLPTLYLVNQGRQELVNYSVQGLYFICPVLFDRAALVLGVGREQQIVNIWRSR